MTQVRTTVSLAPELVDKADQIARQHRWSRSEMIERALDQYIDRWQADELLARLNEVYSKESNQPDAAYHKAIRRYQRQMVEGTW